MNSTASVADREEIDRWWSVFVATGALPAQLTLVQSRLIRAVHRGVLPDAGAVHVKSMRFPRAKDRLRYLLRALPAAHEARMLQAVAQAGVPCPEVIAVRTLRRRGLPWRSLLVLRTLPVVAESCSPTQRLADEARVGLRLLEAGIVHPDLHGDNLLRLRDGQLAVIDLQSARRRSGGATLARREQLAVRLLRDRSGDLAALVRQLCAATLLDEQVSSAKVARRVGVERRRYQQGRVLRCFGNSTEFERRFHLSGVEHRLRGELPAGRWIPGRRSLREAWIGQRRRQVELGEAPLFRAFFHKWWWLGGGAGLYVPATCPDEHISVALQAATTFRSVDVAVGQPPEGDRSE